MKRSITVLALLIVLSGCVTHDKSIKLSEVELKRLESIFNGQETLIVSQWLEIQRLRREIIVEKSKVCI